MRYKLEIARMGNKYVVRRCKKFLFIKRYEALSINNKWWSERDTYAWRDYCLVDTLQEARERKASYCPVPGIFVE